MPDIKTRFRESEKASKEILDYIEDLLKDVRLEIPVEHQPIRRSLMWYAPVESNFGNIITFKIYKRAIEEINKEMVVEEPPPVRSDTENDSFTDRVKELVDSGFSLEDAINGLSGSANLESLAEGMIPGFVKLMESVFPAVPGIDGLSSGAAPISSYMSAGSPNQLTEEIKDDLKSTVGIEVAKKHEKDSAASRVANYAMSAGAAKTAEYSPAKIWHAWVLYPRMKGIHLKAQALGASSASIDDPISYAGHTINDLFNVNLSWFEREIREAAVILSSSLSNSAICCFLSSHVDLNTSKNMFAGYRAFLNVAKTVNTNSIRFTLPDYSEAINAAKDAAICKMFSQLDGVLNKSVTFLRDGFEKMVEKLGGDIKHCEILDNLFDGMIGIVSELKTRCSRMLRNMLSKLDLKRQQSSFINNIMLENMHISRMLNLLDAVEKHMGSAHSCSLSKEARNRQAIDLLNRLSQEGRGLKVHIKGQPLPEGLSPDSPLANLEPIKTIHGFTVSPGIQGEDLPTGELEELFSGCPAAQQQETTFSKIKAKIGKRK